MIAPDVLRPGHSGQLLVALAALLVAVAAVWHGTLSPAQPSLATRSDAPNALEAVRSLAAHTPANGALAHDARSARASVSPSPAVTTPAAAPDAIAPREVVGLPSPIGPTHEPSAHASSARGATDRADGSTVALSQLVAPPVFEARSAGGLAAAPPGRESLESVVHATSTPELAPGDRVVATVSFYYCAAGAGHAGDGGAWCGAMRDGTVVYPGAAACDYTYLGQQFRIEGDPTGRVYTCNDTGGAVHGLHRDIWFATNTEGWSWQREVGRNVVIQIVN
jgi:3D (Asp-Asp-Asp) domain-containing protein